LPRVFAGDFSILLPLLLRTIILDSSRDKDKVSSKEEEESNKISSITHRLLRVARLVARKGLLRLRESLKKEFYIYSKYNKLNIIVFVLVLTLELAQLYILLYTTIKPFKYSYTLTPPFSLIPYLSILPFSTPLSLDYRPSISTTIFILL
jgi:hypothetical protein